MTEKKVSIIVPVYKAEDYLLRCVDSLVNQTYKNIEIILVNDGSPDKSPAMCDGYAARDERIKVIHKENGGLVSAWQAGVVGSSGQYLCFVDSDDWVETEMIEKMVACLSGNNDNQTADDNIIDKEIICCNFVINRPQRESKHYHGLLPGVYEGEELEETIKDNLLGHEERRISMSRCMKLFSRSLIEDNMKYCYTGITMGEDMNITLPALLDCSRVVIMKDALFYHYFYNEESMVHKYDAGMYEGIRTLYRAVKEIYKAKRRESGALQADKEYNYLLLLALKNEIRSAEPGYMKRIKDICGDEINQKIIRGNRVSTRDKTNKLLYILLKHPVSLYIMFVKMVFRIYDGRIKRKSRSIGETG